MNEQILLLLLTEATFQVGDKLEVVRIQDREIVVSRQAAPPPDLGVSTAETIDTQEKLS